MNFKQEFTDAINRIYLNGLEWDLVGILTKTSKVYTLSYDSKILSGIFEILCEPIIIEIAKKHDYEPKREFRINIQNSLYFILKGLKKKLRLILNQHIDSDWEMVRLSLFGLHSVLIVLI